MGVCPAGSEGAKQRPLVADAEEKKSQISADSGLSVTSGSQVVSFLHWCPPERVYFYFLKFSFSFGSSEKRHGVDNELRAARPDEEHQPRLRGQHSGRAQPTRMLWCLGPCSSQPVFSPLPRLLRC